MSDAKKPATESTRGDYAVGYGKPPQRTRFKPGQSGNPRGRPKGTKNLKTDLIEELGETIVVREGDQSRRVSKQRAMLKTLMMRSLKGDTKAASIVYSMMLRLVDTGENAPEADDPLQDAELEILADFEERIRQASVGAAAIAKTADEPENDPESEDGGEGKEGEP